MSAPLFLVDVLPEGDLYRLDGPEGHHAADVQRLRPGEVLILADGRGGTASAIVATAGRGVLDVRITGRDQIAASDPSLTVVQAIAKGDRGELAVATMTEVGVDAIVPWAAARSVARWKDARQPQRWCSTARESAKQARRPRVPLVLPPARTADVVDHVRRSTASYVLHEEAATRLSAVDLPAAGEIVLVVGPEGGIDDDEMTRLATAGATPVRLGDTVLRTSTAGAAAIAALSVRLGRW